MDLLSSELIIKIIYFLNEDIKNIYNISTFYRFIVFNNIRCNICRMKYRKTFNNCYSCSELICKNCQFKCCSCQDIYCDECLVTEEYDHVMIILIFLKMNINFDFNNHNDEKYRYNNTIILLNSYF